MFLTLLTMLTVLTVLPTHRYAVSIRRLTMKTTMWSWQAIVARVIGVVIAVAIGTILVVIVTFPLQLQELGIFIAL